MGQTSSGRHQADLYKQELRGLVEKLVTQGDPNKANAAALSALGEVTAEFGIYAVGPMMTTAMLFQLAEQVQTNTAGENGSQP